MTPKQFVKAYQKYGSLKAVWRNTPGQGYHAIRRLYLQALSEGLMPELPVGRKSNEVIKEPLLFAPEGRVKALETIVVPVPKAGVKRYLFTCAQNDTKLHDQFWLNLLCFARYRDAEIHVSRFAYVKCGLGEANNKENFTSRNRGEIGLREYSWDERLNEYISDKRLEVAPGLVWCGEMNILPTAARPLSGLEVYTGRRSAIFPHVKIALESIASARGEPTKFNYTTGAVTQRNYIQRKAGLKAEFHHCYGALLVEVDADGDWFCRQINADSEGNFYDLDVGVKNGVISIGNRVEAITWGDIHDAEKVDWVREIGWGAGGMLDTLNPRYQFLHDVLHFRGRSHHEIKNPHRMFTRWVQGFDDVKLEVLKANNFIVSVLRPGIQTVIVDSNHHHHLSRWLQEQDGRFDPVNAIYWLRLNEAVYAELRAGNNPNYLQEAILVATGFVPNAKFLGRNEGFIICRDEHGGIENGMHGDLGPNGSRGSALNLSRMGRRANVGHSHSARIVDGIYQAGTSATLEPDWSDGPGSWSHSHIVTYDNGKRAIITMWNKKWRAKHD